MPKRIIFCADGTWNGPGKVIGNQVADDQDDAGELAKDDSTNVWKVFCNLAGTVSQDTADKKQEKEKFQWDGDGRLVQVAKYIHGVGDSSNALEKVFGGAFGAGIISRIVRGYTFISRHYQPGDQIIIIGFSRGAYTARALGGMICRVGLLDTSKYNVSDNEEAYRRGKAAWQLSRSLKFTGSNAVIRTINRGVDWLTSRFAKRELNEGDLIADVSIKAIGVWDTVGSLGVPLYVGGGRLDLFRFTDQVLSDKVESGFHAMAIDELRQDFPVTQWHPRNGIKQVWFVGAHADIGGGYPVSESRLSDVALEWMMQQFSTLGVEWAAQLAVTPDCECSLQAPHEPWKKPPFNLLGRIAQDAREPKPDDVFHRTVKERWLTGSYRPKALSWLTEEQINRMTVVH